MLAIGPLLLAIGPLLAPVELALVFGAASVALQVGVAGLGEGIFRRGLFARGRLLSRGNGLCGGGRWRSRRCGRGWLCRCLLRLWLWLWLRGLLLRLRRWLWWRFGNRRRNLRLRQIRHRLRRSRHGLDRLRRYPPLQPRHLGAALLGLVRTDDTGNHKPSAETGGNRCDHGSGACKIGH